MTRAEAERKIFEHMAAIRDIRDEYCPDDNYLTLTILDDSIAFNNSYFEHLNDEAFHVINFRHSEKYRESTDYE